MALNDYTSPIIEAISVIVNKKIEDLSFDKTIKCEIVDDVDKANGKYTVFDGSIKMDAYCDTSDKYLLGDKVYVMIPSGDYSQQKTIVSKYIEDENTQSITYVSPLKTMIDITGNIFNESTEVFSIAANNAKESRKLLYSVELADCGITPEATKIYDTIGISANFRTEFNDKDVQKGSYGLIIDLTEWDGTTETASQIVFDCGQMFGNPYSFNIPLRQAIKVDKGERVIKSLNVFLYQNNNFKYYENGEYFSYPVITIPKGSLAGNSSESEIIDNIFVSNINICFGEDVTKLEDNVFKIYTYDSSRYSREVDTAGKTNNENPRNIHSFWINKDVNTNEFIGFSDGIVDTEYDEESYLAEYETEYKGASVVISSEDEDEDHPIPQIRESLQIYANAKQITQEIKKIINNLDSDTGVKGLLESLDRNLQAYNVPKESRAITEIAAILELVKNLSFALQDTEDNALGVLTLEKQYINLLKTMNEESTDIPSIDISYYSNMVSNDNSEIADITKIKNKLKDLYENILLGANSVVVSYPSTRAYVVQSQDFITQVVNKIDTGINTLKDYVDGSESIQSKKIKSLYDRYKASTEDNPIPTFKEEYDAFLEENKDRYCIYWYRYKSGFEDQDDRFGTKDWQRIPLPEGASRYQAPGMPAIITDGDSQIYEKVSITTQSTGTLDVEVKEEKFKAILFFNHEKFESEELIFTNDSEISQDVNEQLSNALYIEVGSALDSLDGGLAHSMESHQLYNSHYTLLKSSDAYVNRKIRIRYDGVEGKDEMLIGTMAFWYVPLQATMLRYDDTKLINSGFTRMPLPSELVPKKDANGNVIPNEYELPDHYEAHHKDGYRCYYKNIGAASADSASEDEVIPVNEVDTYFWYQIASIYNPTQTNNAVICKIVKNGYSCEVEKLFTFSTYGNSGTDYTLSIVPAENQSAVLKGGNPLTLKAIFTDYNGEALDATVSWGWYGLDGCFSPEATTDSEQHQLTVSGELDLNEDCPYNVVKATVPWGKLNADTDADQTIYLTALYPVSYATGDYYIDGASVVIYNDLGTNPQYYNGAYKIYSAHDDKEIATQAEKVDKQTGALITRGQTVTWKLLHYQKDKDGNIKSIPGDTYVPQLKKDKDTGNYYLKPAAMYVSSKTEENAIYSVAVCNLTYTDDPTKEYLLYVQPLYVGQNRYGSAMLNTWDEKLTLDYENNVILSAMMGAGYKDEANQFNGVLMGDVGTKSGNETIVTPGIYGFNAGAQSFAWKVDGTGFIGKSGHGRIEFDGNNGIIHSAGWTQKSDGSWTKPPSGKGTLIDLDDGRLLMEGGTNSYFRFNKDKTGALEMSLSGASIQLTDKNKGLSGYIDATASGVVTEFRRYASYYATCDTGSSAKLKSDGNWEDNNGNKDKIAKITFNSTYTNNDESVETESQVNDVALSDIIQDGVTIAVSFTEAELVKETVTQTDTQLNDDTKNNYLEDGQTVHSGTKVSRTGNELKLQIVLNNEKGSSYPIYYKGTPTASGNPFGWQEDAMIYFTCKAIKKTDGTTSYYWEVTDSGSYSNSVTTADTIYNEVSSIGGSLSSAIKQTAESIQSEVRNYAGYYGVCENEGSVREVTLKNAPEKDFEVSDLLKNGVGLAVKFTKANQTSNTIYLKIRENSDATAYTGNISIKFEDGTKHYEWTEYSTLYFVFTDGCWQITDGGNYSKITQTADAITSEVRRTATYYGICNSSSDNTTKEVALSNALQGTDANTTTLDYDKFYKTGVTIAVTFANEQSVTQDVSDGSTQQGTPVDGDINYSYTEKTASTTGATLYLKIINSNATGYSTHPIFMGKNKQQQDKVTGTDNPFGWTAGSTVYFTYDENLTYGEYIGGWRVSDSGAFSKITQTADSIKSEVATLDGKYSSAITQTANSIRSEVVQNVQHHFTTTQIEGSDETYTITVDCSSCPLIVDKNNTTEFLFDINFNVNFPKEKITNFKINFVYKSQKRTYGVKNVGKDNPFYFKKNDILIYILKQDPVDSQWYAIPTTISSSQILQTANSIKADVVEKTGGDDLGFSWALKSDGFRLYNIINDTETAVFECTRNGLILTPKTFNLTTQAFQMKSNGDPYLQINHTPSSIYHGEMTIDYGTSYKVELSDGITVDDLTEGATLSVTNNYTDLATTNVLFSFWSSLTNSYKIFSVSMLSGNQIWWPKNDTYDFYYDGMRFIRQLGIPILSISAKNNMFTMQSLPQYTKKEQIYYVISAYDELGSTIREGEVDIDENGNYYLKKRNEDSYVKRYKKGTRIAVKTLHPYRLGTTKELWYPTIDGYFLCCRGAGTYSGTRVFVEVCPDEHGNRPTYGTSSYNPSTNPNDYTAYTGYYTNNFEESVSKVPMTIDVQSGIITMLSGGLEKAYIYDSRENEGDPRDENGNKYSSIEGIVSNADGSGGQQLTIRSTDCVAPFVIQQANDPLQSFHINWNGSIGYTKRKSINDAWYNTWSISPEGGASFGWVWASSYNGINIVSLANRVAALEQASTGNVGNSSTSSNNGGSTLGPQRFPAFADNTIK